MPPLPTARDATAWTIRRGRLYEFDETEPGEANVSLRDTSGKYDPTNATSPYVGMLVPGKQGRIALQHPTRGTHEPLFTGYVEDILPKRVSTRRMRAEFVLSDGMALLGRSRVAPDSAGGRYYEEQRVDDRILAALADAGWPASRAVSAVGPGRDIFSGNAVARRYGYPSSASHLDVIRDAAAAEFPGVSNVWVDRKGHFKFRGRFARFHPDNVDYGINTWRVGDAATILADPTLIPIAKDGLEFGIDDQHIINSAIALPWNVDPDSVPSQLVEDAASIAKYGRRSWAREGLLTIDDFLGSVDPLAAVKQFAQYYVDNYAEPRVRISRIQFNPHIVPLDHPIAEAMWDFALTVEIGDIVEVNTEHPGGGGFGAAEFFVEGIEQRCTALNENIPRLEVSLDLSPRGYYTSIPNDPDA